MIVGSVLLILVAIGLLVAGLQRGSDPMLWGSVGASALAALTLVVGVRQMAAARAAAEEDTPEPPSRRARRYAAGPPADEPDEPTTSSVPVQPPAIEAHAEDVDDDFDDVDPPDEPPIQLTSPMDAGRVARLPNEVLVIDGRPRYHLAGCVHLLGRESEPLPVAEALELGFSPCSLCEPDSALLAEARRV